MVYNILNRALYRGFHPALAGKEKIVKPDGKVAKGTWLYGCLAVVPMPVPDGAKPQMPILCLHSPERWSGRVGEQSVCPSTLALFSGFWMDTDWETVSKPVQRKWLERGKTSAGWKGIPVFEGDIFWHRDWKAYFVATYDQLRGFRLEPADGDGEPLTWFFGQLKHKGNIWAPPKEFPEKAVRRFHESRNTDARLETIQF